MSAIWAFDPGKMTGVAVWDDGKFWADQYTVEELYQVVDDACSDIGFAQIERFTISAATLKKARETEPLDVIGYLKYAAWRCGFEYGWTKPADVMHSFPDAALKKGGLYTSGKGHANDAARHLAWKLVRTKVMAPGAFLL